MAQLQRMTLMAAAVACIASAQVDPPGRVARLNYVNGPVSFQPAGVDDWVEADPNRPLTSGDHLWVEQNGRAEMHIGSAALRLNGRTAFEFLNLDDQNVQIRLAEGSIEIRLRALDPDQTFEIDTPNLAFSLLRPGIYRIDANLDNETTQVTVRSGEGEITGGGQAIPVRPRDQARVTGDQSFRADVTAAPMPDWFDNWCDSRDRHEERSQSARYVSRDMIGYEDLDDAGDWRPMPEYGAVWYPRWVPANWAPYRNGHWAWIEPWGWTWVDDAPWGFAPFHYGRWAHIGGSWGWIPGPASVRPVYAPALVAWVGGPHFSLSISAGGGGHVGWFPLGPHEVYIPSHHASATYVTRVNTTNTVINNVNITNITNVNNVHYVNQSVPNGVTAVPRAAFLRSRSISQAAVPVGAEDLRSAQVIRSAEIAPNRESVLGHVNANAPHPPAAVMSRQVVDKAPPPAPPIPFAQRRQALEQNPGQPLAQPDAEGIRSQNPMQNRPMIRQAPVTQAAPPQAPPDRPRRGFRGADPGEVPAQPERVQRPQIAPQPQPPIQPRPDRVERPQPHVDHQPAPPPQPRPEVRQEAPRERPAPPEHRDSREREQKRGESKT